MNYPEKPDPLVHPFNARGCCDGSGQEHHRFGALHYVLLCQDRDCQDERAMAWAVECGEVSQATLASLRTRLGF